MFHMFLMFQIFLIWDCQLYNQENIQQIYRPRYKTWQKKRKELGKIQS